MDVVRAERLDLVLMTPALLEAFLARDRARVERLARYTVPDDFPDDGQLGLIDMRRRQIACDPTWREWMLRAIVRRDDRRMVGFVNFHGPPGVNDIAAPAAAELGWTIFPEHRRHGYATETARTLMAWAHRTHGVTRFISATTPDNVASLRVHEKLGFVPTGDLVDGEIVFARDGPA